jgi:hypothetical protein
MAKFIDAARLGDPKAINISTGEATGGETKTLVDWGDIKRENLSYSSQEFMMSIASVKSNR